MLAAALSFAGMSAAVKVVAPTVPNAVVVFARNLLSLVFVGAWIFGRGGPGLATASFKDHLVRALTGLASMYGFFYSIGHLGLAPSVLLVYSLPLYMPAIERVWLKEPWLPKIWVPLVLGFLGILLVLRPGTDFFHGAALVATVSGILAAVAQVGVRKLTAREPALRIVFYFALISTLVAAGPAALAWQQRPSPREAAFLLAAGFFGTVGQVFLARAYACAPAAQVGPFLYSIVVFSGLLDALVWGTFPDLVFFTGAALVVMAGILALRLRRLRAASPLSGPPPR